MSRLQLDIGQHFAIERSRPRTNTVGVTSKLSLHCEQLNKLSYLTNELSKCKLGLINNWYTSGGKFEFGGFFVSSNGLSVTVSVCISCS